VQHGDQAVLEAGRLFVSPGNPPQALVADHVAPALETRERTHQAMLARDQFCSGGEI